jgi:hypothetical protein
LKLIFDGVAYTATGASDKIEARFADKTECVGAYFLSFQTILSFLLNDTFFLSYNDFLLFY